VRAHFNRALLDLQGNQVPLATIRLLALGTTTAYGQTIYADATGGTTRTNPWATTLGEVDFYLDAPDRVRIGILVGAGPEEFWDNVDVTAVNSDSTHPGAGAQSLQIGVGANATGVHATALGQGTQATADSTVALGEQATASDVGALAAGSQSDATAPGAVAIGQSALAQGTQSTAVGDAARAMFDRSVAIGAGAQTDRPHQVVLGTAADTAFFPGGIALQSPDGSTFMVGVTNEGVLYTQQLPTYVPPPEPNEGTGESSGDSGDTDPGDGGGA
jgi:trimeric autotransporter adhesin